MKKLSQPQKIVELLKQNPQQKFTARQIAEAITAQYPQDYQDKKAAFPNEKAFIQQVVAEIGAHKTSILKICADIQMQDKPRPRLYWYENSSDTVGQTKAIWLPPPLLVNTPKKNCGFYRHYTA